MTVDDLAKKLCEAAGHNPEMMVFDWHPEHIGTPDGSVKYYPLGSAKPLWYKWFRTAQRLAEMGLIQVTDKDRS